MLPTWRRVSRKATVPHTFYSICINALHGRRRRRAHACCYQVCMRTAAVHAISYESNPYVAYSSLV